MTTPSALDQIRQMRPEVPRGSESDIRAFSGERFLPGYSDGSIELQHFHRYSFVLPLIVGKHVVDIACGEGYGCDLMGHVAHRVVGIDIDGETIKTARVRYTRPNITFKEGNTSAIPVDSDSADVVISFETLEHVRDQAAFWSELTRILRKDGVLVISSPNRDVYNSQRTDHNNYHVRELTQDELVAELSIRFRSHVLYSQGTLFGSSLVPAMGSSASRTVVSVDPETAVLDWKTGHDVRYPISLAVASDNLPAVLPGESLYTGAYPPNAMASLVGGIAERDRKVRELETRLARLESDQSLLISGFEEQSNTANGDISMDQSIPACHQGSSWITELLKQRDEALLQHGRMRETLDEQNHTVTSLRSLLNECTLRLAGGDSGMAGVKGQATNQVEHTT